MSPIGARTIFAAAQRLALLLGLLAPAPLAWGQPPRFAARLADGTRFEGSELAEWYKADQSPQLDGRPLLDPGRPAVWLLDRRVGPGRPSGPYLEMFSGDRLPGVAEEYVPAGASTVLQQFDYWLVRPLISLRPPRPLEVPQIRVAARFVRRIVWQSGGGEPYRAGTVGLRDGRRISFRAARIRDGEVHLLTSDGTQRLALSQLTELHLPAQDPWQQALTELAVLSPDGQTRLIQVDTDEGLLATASLDRLTAIPGGSESLSDRWSHGLQPAWSLDVIWVPNDRIGCRRMFAPHQIPLHRLQGIEARTGADRGAGHWWDAQQNRNVGGGPLRCGELDFGWGYGVQAPSRLSFPLPPLPGTFRCEFGLDRLTRGGGCVQARVLLAGTADQTLYESPVRLGSQPTVAIGPVALPPADSGPRQLVLEVDGAHGNRPAGADPFFIRDMADWLDPVLELDGPAWTRAIQQEVSRQVPAWSGWAVQPQQKLSWPSRLRESHVDFGSFLRCMEIREEPLQLSRTVDLAPGRNWLVVSVSRGGARDIKPELELRLEGEEIARREIPYRDSWQAEAEPLLFELPGPAGQQSQQASLQLQLAPAPQIPVLWEGILLTQQLPMLRTLLEDEGLLSAEHGGPPAAVVSRPRYSGATAVEIVPPGKYRLPLDRPLLIRERPQWGEFRFLRFAVYKTGGGRFCLELNHTGQQSQPAGYDGGQGPACLESAKRVWDRELGPQWTVITRDLYADFGPLQIAALTLSIPDGQTAVFDGLYAARSGNDFRHLPPPAPADAP